MDKTLDPTYNERKRLKRVLYVTKFFYIGIKEICSEPVRCELVLVESRTQCISSKNSEFDVT